MAFAKRSGFSITKDAKKKSYVLELMSFFHFLPGTIVSRQS
jgi:hypothetical protein